MFERLRIRKVRIAAKLYQLNWREEDHIGGIATRVLARLNCINYSGFGEHPLEAADRAMKALRELELECKALRKQLADARVWPDKQVWKETPWEGVTVRTVLSAQYFDPKRPKSRNIHRLVMTDFSRLSSPPGYWVKEDWFIKESAEGDRGYKYNEIMNEWREDYAGS